MGSIPLNYPNGKALYVYYALSESFNVPREERAPSGLMVPRSNADIKADVDLEVRKYLIKRIKAIYARDERATGEAAFEASFVDPEFTGQP